jgi:hypothetical protein
LIFFFLSGVELYEMGVACVVVGLKEAEEAFEGAGETVWEK